MQFTHPEILYALALLVIPILIHLFQLRRFQKVPFTNVEFLKKVDLQTRKSQKLKKWLTLITRLLLLAAIIFAFAQPYSSKSNSLNVDTETVIYLDNSFSMQAKGNQGELLRRAVQDIIGTLDEANEVTVYTNEETYLNATAKSLRNDLLQLNYSSSQLDYNAAFLKGKKLFSTNSETIKNLILISDFQQNKTLNFNLSDSLVETHLVKLNPLNSINTSIDSLYIANQTASNIELHAQVKQRENAIENLPVSLFNNDELITKTAVNSDNNIAIFTIPNNQSLNGRISIDDASLQFDNDFFFNINQRPKINVLSINQVDDDHLRRVFSNDEFNYTNAASNQLNFNDIDKQNLIILNELNSIPQALNNALVAFVNDDSKLLIIPSIDSDLMSYNQLFANFGIMQFSSENSNERKVTNINYSHPIFKDVFDTKVANFQYPKINSFYEFSSNSSSLLSFEDGKPFLAQLNNVFIFSAAISEENSNFINSPLIVPTLYNIGRQSFKLPQLYFTIQNENTFEVNTTIQQDDILKMSLNGSEIIPQQRTFTDKVVITTQETPDLAGTYNVNNKTITLEQVSYNYNRLESDLRYHDLSTLNHTNIGNSIPEVINQIKSDTNINALWKWFVIFALILLIIEMLILRFFK